jgi:hypothetical protein
MAPSKRLHIAQRDEVLMVNRGLLDKDHLVYVILASKKLVYDLGRSRVAYVGTTSAGIERVASSVAAQSAGVLTLRGVTEATVSILTCSTRRGVSGKASARRLERAFLLMFREEFGSVPRCNIQGKGIKEIDEFEYFAESRVRSLVREWS